MRLYRDLGREVDTHRRSLGQIRQALERLYGDLDGTLTLTGVDLAEPDYRLLGEIKAHVGEMSSTLAADVVRLEALLLTLLRQGKGDEPAATLPHPSLLEAPPEPAEVMARNQWADDFSNR